MVTRNPAIITHQLRVGSCNPIIQPGFVKFQVKPGFSYISIVWWWCEINGMYGLDLGGIPIVVRFGIPRSHPGGILEFWAPDGWDPRYRGEWMRILWSFPIAFFTISQWYGSFGIGESRFL